MPRPPGARPALAGPTWILALHQTAARGRRGRPWAFPRGNFAATLVLRPSETPDKVALRSFVAALALFDAFAAVTGRTEPFALKWPNDVLLNGGKVAGILLESAGRAAAGHLAIGIGVNLVAAPPPRDVEPEALRPCQSGGRNWRTSLARGVPRPPRRRLCRPGAPASPPMAFAPIRTAWLSRATRLGATITARTGTETLTGIFETHRRGRAT